MILKKDLNSKFVNTKEYGIIDTSILPMKVRLKENGSYFIDWSLIKGEYILLEYGGRNQHDYGSRILNYGEDLNDLEMDLFKHLMVKLFPDDIKKDENKILNEFMFFLRKIK